MTPLEELQAAHKRLSELRVAYTNPWQVVTCSHPEDAGWKHLVIRDDRGEEIAEGVDDVGGADLIVTLHRTIAAQLVILAAAMEDYEGIFVGDCPYPPHVLSLARAINGEAS